MSGLFATFNVGKRGLFGQQQAINTTAHNIANANTEGYSRQRAIMETTRPFGMPSMNNQVGPGQIGTGVEVSSIQRIRDNFMDFQVRREKSTLGQYEARDKYLSEIESIFNEPSDTGISTLVGKFFDSWEQLSKQAETSNARTIVAQQSAALADALNHTYNQLIEVKKNAQESIKQSVFDANAMLERIDKLNQQIISVKVSGMEPNDLMDSRDLLLDQLSEKFNIKVDADNFYSINLRPDDVSGQNVDDKQLLVRKNPNDEVRRFSYVKSIESTGNLGEYTVTYLKNGDKDQEATMTVTGITSEDDYKRLEQCRVIWSQSNSNDDEKDGLAIRKDGTEIPNVSPPGIPTSVSLSELALFELADDKYRGEFKGFMSVQKDADDYIDQLNRLAKALAFSVNAVHSGKESVQYKVDAFNNIIHDVNGNPIIEQINDNMPFFVVKGDTSTLNEKNIDASNISVNKTILDNVMNIKTGITGNPDVDGEKDGKRALAIASLRDTLLQIQSIKSGTDRSTFITNMTGGLELDSNLGVNTIKSDTKGMKIDNYFKDTINKLGIQGQEAQRIVKNQGVLLQGFQERRDSISGVSLDEEMANLIQFQHAYQANAKIISTVDELLDVVVNGLKR